MFSLVHSFELQTPTAKSSLDISMRMSIRHYFLTFLKPKPHACSPPTKSIPSTVISQLRKNSILSVALAWSSGVNLDHYPCPNCFSPYIQSSSKFHWFQFQTISRIWKLLSSFTTITLVQTTFSFSLDDCNSLPTDVPASTQILLEYILKIVGRGTP